MLKILAFTDFHGSSIALKKIIIKAKKEKPNLIICAGDFTVFEQDMRQILIRLDGMGIPLLMIPGNHESHFTLKNATLNLMNIKYIHKGFYRTGNYFFMGYGGGGFSLSDKTFVYWADKTIKKAKDDDYIVLVLHGPPYNTKLDLVMGEHSGNKDYANFIVKNKIPLVFCGHLHENFEIVDCIKKSMIVNPGPYGMIFEI